MRLASRGIVRVVPALLLAALAACDAGPVTPIDEETPPDTTTVDPCPGCVPKHPDLTPVVVEVASPTSQNAGEPYPIVEPGRVRFEVRVQNVGDTVAVGGRVEVSFWGARATLDVPPVTVSSIWIGSVELDVGTTSPFRGSATSRVEARTHLVDDTVATNNLLRSQMYGIAVPCYRFRAEELADTARVNRPWRSRLVLENLSTRATGPPVTVRICLWQETAWCRAEFWTTVGRFDSPALGPGASFVLADSVVIPPAAAWQDEAGLYTVQMQWLDTPTDDPYGYGHPSAGTITKSLWLRPDYEGACHPPGLVAERPVSLPSYNCGLRPPTTRQEPAWSDEPTLLFRFHLVRFDAIAGRTYRIERSDDAYPFRGYDIDGEPLTDLDPARDRVRFAGSGTVYLPLYSAGPALTVTLREVF